MLPKRAGDEASGTLMARGFWMMIGSKLTEAEMTQLTERVLDRCKWFPSVAECKEIMAEQSYANPFYRKARAQLLDHHGYPKLAAPVRQLADDR